MDNRGKEHVKQECQSVILQDLWLFLLGLFPFRLRQLPFFDVVGASDSAYISTSPTSHADPLIVPKVLLYGTKSVEEHYERLHEWLLVAKEKTSTAKEEKFHGDILHSLGFEYRLTSFNYHKYCKSHGIGMKKKTFDENNSNCENGRKNNKITVDSSYGIIDHVSGNNQEVNTLLTHEMQLNTSCSYSYSAWTSQSLSSIPHVQERQITLTFLVHMASNTVITEENRSQFIADGEMYEIIAQLCQEYAQEVIKREGELVWIHVSNQHTDKAVEDCNLDLFKHSPIRALVHHDLIISTTKDSSLSLYDACSDIDNPVLSPSSNNNIKIYQRSQEGIQASTLTNVPILLIITGKGKVRAGIFSRKHLMTSGIEVSTALLMVREATRRKMKVIILDPNARGDHNGMETFEQSMNTLFTSDQKQVHNQVEDTATENITLSKTKLCQCPTVNKNTNIGTSVDGYSNNFPANPSTSPVPYDQCGRSLFILAHSASGAQLVRYLMYSHNGRDLLPTIRAIVFTDSTHSIQWPSKSFNHNDCLLKFLQSEASLYIRSMNTNLEDDWERLEAGDECVSNNAWKHRFGSIRTVWSGTKEHSLSNWSAHTQIWKHFDDILLQDCKTSDRSPLQNNTAG